MKITKELKNKKKNYFLDNSKYIFEYFENKKKVRKTILFMVKWAG